jgi:hypothetical protein
MIALRNSVNVQDVATVTAAFSLVRNVASGIGIVIGSVAFINNMRDQSHPLITALGASDAELFSGRNSQANVLLIKSFPGVQRDKVRKCSWISMRNIWIVTVALGLF